MSSPESVLAALRALRRSLLEVFPHGWFDREHAGHLAWEWWTALSRIDRSGGTRVPSLSDPDDVCTLCEMMFLGARFVSAFGGAFAGGVSGRLDCYGDPGLQRQLRGTIEDPSQFMDRLVELTRAAWHIEQMHTVDPLAGTGQADLLVRIPGFDLPLLTECKRLTREAGPDRPGKLVNTANKQIKESSMAGSGEAYGLLVLDITDRGRQIYRRHGHQPVTRFVPNHNALEIDQRLRPSLTRSNSHVGAVLIQWNEIRERPETDAKRFNIRVRSHVVTHQAPRHRVPDELIELLERGAGEMSFRVRFDDR